MTNAVAVDTRDAIISAAFACFRTRGLAKTTIVDIAKAADVSRSTFYEYFRDKETIVEACAEAASQRFYRNMAKAIDRHGGSTLEGRLVRAAVFVAQAAGVQLTIGHQITMLITLMLTSKGVAGVPRASLVILAGTLASYGLPLEGVTLILGVDELMDMARTMINVVGNCLATVVIAKWEGEFNEASDETLAIAAARGEI